MNKSQLTFTPQPAPAGGGDNPGRTSGVIPPDMPDADDRSLNGTPTTDERSFNDPVSKGSPIAEQARGLAPADGNDDEDDELVFWQTLPDNERVSPHCDECTAYINTQGSIVLRRRADPSEDFDPVILIAPPYLPRLIERLQELAKQAGG
jgi:hypothetical protein